MIKRHVPIIVGLTLACLGGTANATDVQSTLAQWRKHIVEKSSYGVLVELNSDYYQSLLEIGPNCLPEVFAAYREEQDDHVLRCYEMLVARVGHFDFYHYSVKPLSIRGYEFEEKGGKPLLSKEIDSRGLYANDNPSQDRDKLVQWWDQRESFKRERAARKNEIRELTGKDKKSFQAFDRRKARAFAKLKVYGIYALPDYLDIINDDNNPAVFCEFLRVSNHQAFQTLKMTGDTVGDARLVDEAYPTRKQKIDLICAWWSQFGETYKDLKNLHVEIDERVGKMRDGKE